MKLESEEMVYHNIMLTYAVVGGAFDPLVMGT